MKTIIDNQYDNKYYAYKFNYSNEYKYNNKTIICKGNLVRKHW